jgi:hypothetical protein
MVVVAVVVLVRAGRLAVDDAIEGVILAAGEREAT